MGSCGSKHCELHQKAIREGPRGDAAFKRSLHDNSKTFSTNTWNTSRRNILDVDVTFHVGREPELWKIPAQKQMLAESNPVFHAMFLGPWAHQADNIIVVTDVDGRGFENLINYLYGEEIQLRSVPTAVATLHAAQKYLCTGLTEFCVNYLCQQINSSNVLHVLQHALFYAALLPSTSSSNTSFEPTAPPESALEESPSTEDNTRNSTLVSDQDATNWCNSLVQKCLKFVDESGSSILASEDFEDLDRETIRLILERDSLEVVCESEILDALCRWSQCECRRRQMDLSPANRRNVLGDLLWQVRFLAMSPEEFLMGPIASGLLTSKEQRLFMEYRAGTKNSADLPTYLQTNLPRLNTKRSRSLTKRIGSITENHDSNKKSKKAFSCSKSELLKCHGRLDRTNVTEKIFICLACIFE